MYSPRDVTKDNNFRNVMKLIIQLENKANELCYNIKTSIDIVNYRTTKKLMLELITNLKIRAGRTIEYKDKIELNPNKRLQ